MVEFSAVLPTDDLGPIIERLARVSDLEQLRYWSTSRQTWRRLYDVAHAVRSADDLTRIPDPEPADLVEGASFHSLQDDNDPVSAVVVTMTIRQRREDSLLATFRNATSGRFLGLRVLPAGSAESMLHLHRTDRGTLLLRLVSRTTADLPVWMLPSTNSHANRAVAFYRYLAGIPTDQEPPARR